MPERTSIFRHFRPIGGHKPSPQARTFAPGEHVLLNDTPTKHLYHVKKGSVTAHEVDVIRGIRRGPNHVFVAVEGGEDRMVLFGADAYRNNRTTSYLYKAGADGADVVMYDTPSILKMCEDREFIIFLAQGILYGSELAQEFRTRLVEQYARTRLPYFNPHDALALLYRCSKEEERIIITFCETIMLDVTNARCKRTDKPSIAFSGTPVPAKRTATSDGVPRMADDPREDMRTLAMPALHRETEMSMIDLAKETTLPKDGVMIRPSEAMVGSLYRLLSGVIEVISDLGTGKERICARHSRVASPHGEDPRKIGFTPILGARSFISGRPNKFHYIARSPCTIETITTREIGRQYAARDCTWLVRELLRNSDMPAEVKEEWLVELERRHETQLLPGFRKEDMKGLLTVTNGDNDSGRHNEAYADYACEMLWRYMGAQTKSDPNRTDMAFVPLDRHIG